MACFLPVLMIARPLNRHVLQSPFGHFAAQCLSSIQAEPSVESNSERAEPSSRRATAGTNRRGTSLFSEARATNEWSGQLEGWT